MVLSKTCNYGLRAALYVAAQTEKQFVPIREISDGLNISFHFLTKILQILTQENLMNSFRGPNGGVALARPAGSITILDVVLAIDGPDLFQKCLLGLDRCSDVNPCPLHEKWAAARSDVQNIFANATLEELARKIKENRFRITDLVT